MYWISDKNKALSLACRARDIEVNLKTEMSNIEVEEINIYLDETKQVKPIFENVMVKDLMDERYKNSIIMYNYRIEDAYNNDLTCELHEIIKIHHYIPSKIRNTGYATTRIIFNKNEQNIILTIDENENRHKEINYKNVIEICKTHNIEFKNQTMGALVQEVRNNFFDGPTSKRIKLNKARRNELHLKFNKKCNCCNKEVDIKEVHIDHIKPLYKGGKNDDENLQVLCVECHLEKTQLDMNNNEWVKISDTKSTYNSQLHKIINDSSSSVFSFHETFQMIDKNFKINETRKKE